MTMFISLFLKFNKTIRNIALLKGVIREYLHFTMIFWKNYTKSNFVYSENTYFIILLDVTTVFYNFAKNVFKKGRNVI